MLDVNIPQTGTIWGSHHALPAEPLPARGGGVLEGTTKAPGTPPTDASHQGNCWIVSTRSEEPETTGRRPPVTGGNHNSARGTNPLTGWERAQTPRTNNSYVFACGGGGSMNSRACLRAAAWRRRGGGLPVHVRPPQEPLDVRRGAATRAPRSRRAEEKRGEETERKEDLPRDAVMMGRRQARRSRLSSWCRPPPSLNEAPSSSSSSSV